MTARLIRGVGFPFQESGRGPLVEFLTCFPLQRCGVPRVRGRQVFYIALQGDIMHGQQPALPAKERTACGFSSFGKLTAETY